MSATLLAKPFAARALRSNVTSTTRRARIGAVRVSAEKKQQVCVFDEGLRHV